MANRILTDHDRDLMRYADPILAGAKMGDRTALSRLQKVMSTVLDPGERLVFNLTQGIWGYEFKDTRELAAEWACPREGLSALRNQVYRTVREALLKSEKPQ